MSIALPVPAKEPLTIRLCGPRGFCAGVDRAIQVVVAALKKYGPPVYVRHEIVHNRYVVDGLAARGAVFIEELSEIPEEYRDRPVVFSAHGVPQSIPEEAKKLNLFYLDATCPLVSKVHKQALRHERRGRHIILIGHAGHPEVIGTMGQLQNGVASLIETIEDAWNFQPAAGEKLGYVTQTTLSVADTKDIIAILEQRFPDIDAPHTESICYATTNRQESVKVAAPGSDLFLIVGAPNSSNSCRLVEVAERAGAAQALLVQQSSDIILEQFKTLRIVGLSAGASAPEIIVSEIIEKFAQYYDVSIELAEIMQEKERFLVHRQLRDVTLTTEDMAFLNGF